MPVETSELQFSEQQKQLMQEKDISEDEVGECISEEMADGVDQEQAIAICLSKLESGNAEPEKNVEDMDLEEKQDTLREKQEEIKTISQKVNAKDVEVKQENSDGEIVVNIPIQAMTEDRDGDYINEKGQESIIRQLKSGQVPLVLNHGIGSNDAMYDFRDIVGQFIDGDNRNGTTIGTARMRRNEKDGDSLHPDAKEIVDLLEQDMPIGFSIGFIPDKEKTKERENGGMEISELDLMEVSAVGIPSNPDAVPQAMGQAVAMAKNAGFNKNEIMDTIEKGLNNAMTEKEGSEGQEQNEGKSNETTKQFSDDEVQEILGTVGDALSNHVDEAMNQIEEELQSGMDEEEEETDEEDMDDEENEEEEMNQNDGGSGHTEDDKDSSTESADSKSETEQETEEEEEKDSEGLSEDEKQPKHGNEGGTITEAKDPETEEDKEGKSEEESFDPQKVTQNAELW